MPVSQPFRVNDRLCSESMIEKLFRITPTLLIGYVTIVLPMAISMAIEIRQEIVPFKVRPVFKFKTLQTFCLIWY